LKRFLQSGIRENAPEVACGCPQGMFHVEHLVIEDQLDGVGGHIRAIEAIVHDD